MSSPTKYIVFKHGSGEDILIFGSTQIHCEVACCHQLHLEDILGAGFISIGMVEDKRYGGMKVECNCYGRSDSLSIDSRGDKDTFLARMALNLMD